MAIEPAQGDRAEPVEQLPITDQELDLHSLEVTLLPIANVGKIMRGARKSFL